MPSWIENQNQILPFLTLAKLGMGGQNVRVGFTSSAHPNHDDGNYLLQVLLRIK